MTRSETDISKLLSYVLRHRPDEAGLTLDEGGWVDVGKLLSGLSTLGTPLDRTTLERLVAVNDKRRFSFSPDGSRIRANQGHSAPVELGLPPLEPPPALFHGTADRFLPSIMAQGLVRGERHHVHLSADRDTARRVGERHGRPVVLRVGSGAMHRDGFPFRRSDNGVWLVSAVPPAYLEVDPGP